MPGPKLLTSLLPKFSPAGRKLVTEGALAVQAELRSKLLPILIQHGTFEGKIAELSPALRDYTAAIKDIPRTSPGLINFSLDPEDHAANGNFYDESGRPLTDIEAYQAIAEGTMLLGTGSRVTLKKALVKADAIATALSIPKRVHLYLAMDPARWMSENLIDIMEVPLVKLAPTVVLNALRNEAAAINPKVLKIYHIGHSAGSYPQMLAIQVFSAEHMEHAKFLEFAPAVHPNGMLALIQNKLETNASISVVVSGIDYIYEGAEVFSHLTANGVWASVPEDVTVQGYSHAAEKMAEQIALKLDGKTLPDYIDANSAQRANIVKPFYESNGSYSPEIRKVAWSRLERKLNPNIDKERLREARGEGGMRGLPREGGTPIGGLPGGTAGSFNPDTNPGRGTSGEGLPRDHDGPREEHEGRGRPGRGGAIE